MCRLPGEGSCGLSRVVHHLILTVCRTHTDNGARQSNQRCAPRGEEVRSSGRLTEAVGDDDGVDAERDVALRCAAPPSDGVHAGNPTDGVASARLHEPVRPARAILSRVSKTDSVANRESITILLIAREAVVVVDGFE